MKKRKPLTAKQKEEQAFLKRWENVKSSPSLFEKMDKDPVFDSQLKKRIRYDQYGYPINEVTLSNRNSIGKTRGPKKS